MMGYGLILAATVLAFNSSALAQVSPGQAQAPLNGLLPVQCDPIESGHLFVHSATVPEYYVIEMSGPTLALQIGPFAQFEVKDQDGKAAPDVKGSMTAQIDRIIPFYDERRQVPANRGQQQPTFEVRRVYALTVSFKSTAYDLDWKEGGDYRYPDKQLTRDIFCSTVEPIR